MENDRGQQGMTVTTDRMVNHFKSNRNKSRMAQSKDEEKREKLIKIVQCLLGVGLFLVFLGLLCSCEMPTAMTWNYWFPPSITINETNVTVNENVTVNNEHVEETEAPHYHPVIRPVDMDDE